MKVTDIDKLSYSRGMRFTKAELKELERYEKYLNRLLAQQEKAEERRVKNQFRRKVKMHVYTLPDLSEKLHLSVKTLREYIRRGELTASKVGRHYLVTGRDVKKFLEQTRYIHQYSIR